MPRAYRRYRRVSRKWGRWNAYEFFSCSNPPNQGDQSESGDNRGRQPACDNGTGRELFTAEPNGRHGDRHNLEPCIGMVSNRNQQDQVKNDRYRTFQRGQPIIPIGFALTQAHQPDQQKEKVNRLSLILTHFLFINLN